jgi:hypothetical protein
VQAVGGPVPREAAIETPSEADGSSGDDDVAVGDDLVCVVVDA